MENNHYTFGENSLFAKNLKIASCYNNDLAKSEVGYAFSNSNPSMNSLQFPKKGSVLIKMISDKKEALQTQLNEMIVSQAGYKTQLTESGVITFKNRGDYEEADYDYNSTSQEVRDVCYSYNDFRYKINRQNEEIKTCQALIDNLEENKTYTLSTPQVLALQKAMEFDLMKAEENDIEKGGEGSKGGKIIGHTKSGKAIYANHNHLNHKYFTSKDHSDAAKLHNEILDKLVKKIPKGADEGEGGKAEDKAYDEKKKMDHHVKKFREKEHEEEAPKHKKGDHVIDSEGRKGKVTHADDKEIAVEHDNGDVSGYEHHQVKKYEDKKEKIIGKTKSGKDVHLDPKHESHKKFTEDDHEDARGIHMNEEVTKRNMQERDEAAADHGRVADKMRGKYDTKKDIKKAFEDLGL